MIYLNNAAGTQPYPEVVGTIVDILMNSWGNPHDSTSFGHKASVIIDDVTRQVARDINCSPDEIIWTSGACEANSLAIMGLLNKNPNMNLYTTHLEHASIIEITKTLPQNRVGFIQTNKEGFVDLNDLEKTLVWHYRNKKPLLVSITYANSEIGSIQQMSVIAKIVHKYGAILHVDATQLYGWADWIDVKDIGIDLMSVSGQKLHCVKGVGFLYVRNGVELMPLIYGSQQNGIRGGTMPTHLIAAFGKALEITRERNNKDKVQECRDYMLSKLLQIPGTQLNGTDWLLQRLPGNISLTIKDVNAEALVTMCDVIGEIIIGKGSACQSYELKPSEALLSIDLTEDEALSTVRISLDEELSKEVMDEVVDTIEKLVKRLRL